MKVVIEGGGFTEASDCLANANWWAAVHTDDLGSALTGSGAMAGDSSFAGDFAAAYDEAATATLAACDDIVNGLGSLCRLTYCSYENHLRAEQSSIASTIAVSTEPVARTDVLYGAATPPPPSSLGGDASFVPDWANIILDHIEGFVWPDADVDRLRSTAAAWRTAASGLEMVSERTGGAITALLGERSPEILPAAGAIGDLRLSIEDVAAVCTQLATACDDYATQVETQRELILDLVRDLIRDAVLIAAAGFVLGLVTGGSTNAVAAWINSGKLASQVPVFKALVEALRLWGARAAYGLRAGAEAVVRASTQLSRFTLVAPIRSKTTAGLLRTHEGGAIGAHTLERHVGKTDEFLRARLRAERKKSVSTFTNEAIADGAIRQALHEARARLASWLASSTGRGLAIESKMDEVIGRIMFANRDVRPGTTVRMFLVKDPSMPDGYRILTSYVKP